MTLNELWVRVLETFITGLFWLACTAVCVYIARKPMIGFRLQVLLTIPCLMVMALGSFATALSLYLQKPVTIAWAQGPSCVAKVYVACSLVGYAPRLAFMFMSFGKIERVARHAVDDDIEISSVRFQAPRNLMTRVRRKRAGDGAT